MKNVQKKENTCRSSCPAHADSLPQQQQQQ
jgi:hypothetical protein